MNPTVPGGDLEFIPCFGNSFTKSEQSLAGDPHDARILAQSPGDQEICVRRVSWRKARCLCLFVVSLGIDLIAISCRVNDRTILQYQNPERTVSNTIHKYDEQ